MRKAMNGCIATMALLILFLIIPTLTANAETQDTDSIKLFEVTTTYLTMRTAPEEGADIVGHLVEGNKLRTFAEFNGWVKTFYDGKPVWVMAEHLHLLKESKSEAKNKDTKNVASTNKETEDEKQVVERKVEYVPHGLAMEGTSSEEVELPVGYLEPKQVKISESAITVTKDELAGYHIVIDPGHGGKDSGAINEGVYEKNINLATAQKVAKRLTERGAKVTLTRQNDTFISLANRVEKSNSQNTDVFISLHYNYFSDPQASGINTYYYNEDTSKDLANNIQQALIHHVDMQDRGARTADYYVLVHNHKPSVLIELGFMTNPDDLEKIQTDTYQDAVANAITDGLVNYYDEGK